ncbi:metalloregulator ArsR/SmtB family transcription factor [Paeniroseomonas aquatica]|uniref:Metalloregulator ArsR/SmtB family transcription factor n=1 Tax=Paeniroseomonas aquatica TaxID=373043 RepID=A0ABT8ACV2_9PROT|nr:metalloregulator ArsR/SmtB family transcription factor [Paeniroseomonas aquatica]MDN3567500.1 metalloregulator ArsR/SmtB family transcription factor [Paeniroseomonas aquatica]
MEKNLAIAGLGALAQGTRLDAFRLLVAAAPEGLPAGTVARRLAVPQNTLSAHLAILARAGLVRSARQGRSVIYAVDLDRLRALMLFLAEDCCGGRTELCAPLIAALAPCRGAAPEPCRAAGTVPP